MDNQVNTINKLANSIASYPGFPKPGIVFRDLNPLYKDLTLFDELIRISTEKANQLGKFDLVAGIESRGFILASALARSLNLGFLPIRKKGKLPGEVLSANYNLEYGEDTLQVQKDESLRNARILIVDDVFATGGTLLAAKELITGISQIEPAVLVILDIQLNNIKNLNLPYAIVIE